jgi:hypothetical protein
VKCGQHPKLEYHSYCSKCHRQSHRKWRISNGYKPHQLLKKTSRHYVNTLFKRGRIHRKACEFCGQPSVNFHHRSYGPRSLDIEHVCHNCHVLLHHIERKMLTLFKNLEYGSLSHQK